MKVSLIVAVAENGVIGRNNELPWRLSADLRRFKELTMGHAIIMGRKTFESIGRPLPGRRMLVVTRQPHFEAPGVESVNSLDAALAAAARPGNEEAFVIGGAEIFRDATAHADWLYVTRVHAQVDGDVFFPPLDKEQWRLKSAEQHQADAKNEYPVTFEVYERTR
jgi:dihydrofolate reductase